MTNIAHSAPAPDTSPDAPPHRYTAKMADDIELRWQAWWGDHNTFRQPNPDEPGFDATKPKFYCLDMFPYPSGAGLHVGHPEGYTATDIICRAKRMQGFNVLHPMGWDAFGLPAEQYAIQTGVHPAITTSNAIDNFRRQLKRFGFSYDWSREISTIDPAYYKWTQWIWLRAYNSWFDPEATNRHGGTGCAKPISELTSELEAGRMGVSITGMPIPISPGRHATEHIGGTKTGVRMWHDISPQDKRNFIDDQRLAYLDEPVVNWCPQLGTALANEEVIDGKSERGSFPVFRKPLRQWMFRITAYTERLLDGLDDVDWPESTRTQQREWIGRSEGAEIDFALDVPEGWNIEATSSDGAPGALRIFTTRPDTIGGATYMVIAPEHALVDALLTEPCSKTDVGALRNYVDTATHRTDIERQEAKDKTGVFSGMYAINPFTNKPIPIWIADYVLMGYGTGAIMAVPGQDQRDWDFAKTFDLPIIRTIQPPAGFDGEAYTGDGAAINSSLLDGLDIANAKIKIIEWLEDKGLGTRRINYRLRDWLFSRQRYWGEPFPVVFDERGAHHGVHESTLPIKLPDLADYTPEVSDEPKPLLAKATDWINTTAGASGIDADGLPADAPMMRESNTMPGWAGSCWYYLRYCDAHNTNRLVGAQSEHYWMAPAKGQPAHTGGVDLYVGGAEHAVLHLLYARFWHKFLYDLGEISTDEPFRKLFHQGMILSHAYQRDDKSLVPVDEVDERDEGIFIERATGKNVKQIVAKMSKSLRNVVNPDDVIAQYGADTFRLYEMYLGPLEASKPWNTRDIVGLYRLLQGIWRLVIDEHTGELVLRDEPDASVELQLHRTIAKVTDDIDRMAFNTAIGSIFELRNAATKAGGLTADQLDRFVRTLAPFAPHIAEELWSRLSKPAPVSSAPWPEFDPAMLIDDMAEIAVQILGKIKAKITVPANTDAATLERTALDDPRIVKLLEGKTVRKVIVVPGRLVNIVAH